jgi:cell division septation protein DedD
MRNESLQGDQSGDNKMTTRTLLLALLASFVSLTLHAAPAVVEAVQYPAWLERDGRSVPLTPGTVLQSNDQLRTGENARVQLKMGEGSTVKLGEKAKFQIERVEEKGIFRATLNVLTGAFRFTTDALKKKVRRDVSINAKNVTAGVRGTDLWGKADDDRDLVCLLEGQITVGTAGHPTVTLDQPLDFYQKPRDGAPQVAKVDAKQVEVWSRETEISKEGAAASSAGRWMVTAAVLKDRDPALKLARELRAAGYPAEVGSDNRGFLVQVKGLSGENEARALMGNIRAMEGVKSPFVGQSPAR